MSVPGPRVSIVIAAYNAREWVCEAVDSALSQVGVRCEVIVVDDGSTDDTGALLLARYGKRIVYVRQPNRGLAAARNTGLARACGEYVQFLDADDLLLPSKVVTHVAALEANPDVSVTYSDFAYFDDGDPQRTRTSGLQHRYCSGNVWEPLILGNFIVVHAALARLAHVQGAGGFDQTLHACEDYDLWLRLAAQGREFLHTPGVLVLYRRRPGSMSSHRSSQIKSTLAVLDKMSRTQRLGPKLLEAHRRSVNRLHGLMVLSMILSALSRFKTGHFREAGSIVLDAVTYDSVASPARAAALLALGCEGIRCRLLRRRGQGG